MPTTPAHPLLTSPLALAIRAELARLEDLAQFAGILDASDPGHPGAPQHAYECAMVQIRTDLISHVRHGRDPLLCPYLDGWSADVRRILLEAHANARAAVKAAKDVETSPIPFAPSALATEPVEPLPPGTHVHAYTLESLPPRCACGAVEPA